MVGKSRNMSADMIFMPGLLGLMLPTLCEARTAAPTPVDTCTVTPKNLRAGKEEGGEEADDETGDSTRQRPGR